MALLWQQTIDDNHYEVRTAGGSVRLYRNGVNHSQWNPKRPLSGSIWDLITLPTLHRPLNSLEDVLILGFGAGSVGRQILELVMPKRIVGIEMDPIHLSIADGFFQCSSGFDLIAGDAVDWVNESAEKASYDVIIDDDESLDDDDELELGDVRVPMKYPAKAPYAPGLSRYLRPCRSQAEPWSGWSRRGRKCLRRSPKPLASSLIHLMREG